LYSTNMGDTAQVWSISDARKTDTHTSRSAALKQIEPSCRLLDAVENLQTATVSFVTSVHGNVAVFGVSEFGDLWKCRSVRAFMLQVARVWS
jgi:hypothetical protein